MRHSYSVSLITQGDTRFYSLTLPIEVLTSTAFVSTREEDPMEGFQRLLDKNKAQRIANYVDAGGVIPTSIVLSAQSDSEFQYDVKKKTISFSDNRRGFLILDGQHRVFGFNLSNVDLRVPVVIFNDLTRKEEVKLFIDINTQQKQVPNELLLDIRKLTQEEGDTESLTRYLFDSFDTRADSILLGMMSASARKSGKISRVTFNSAVKHTVDQFLESDRELIWEGLNLYFKSIVKCFDEEKSIPASAISNPLVFKAWMNFFPYVMQRYLDRNGMVFRIDLFTDLIRPVVIKLPLKNLTNPSGGYQVVLDSMTTHFFSTKLSLKKK